MKHIDGGFRMSFNFNGMSDYEVALFIEEEGPFSEVEYKQIMDAMFERRGYWAEFSRNVENNIKKGFGIYDQDTLDELVQESTIWLMDFIADNMDLSRMRNPEKLHFASLIFQMRGIRTEISRAIKQYQRETMMDDTYESEDQEYLGMGRADTSREWTVQVLIDQFKKKLTSVQAQIFDMLATEYTVREIAKEFGKSVGWVEKQKSVLFDLYNKYVMQEARKILKKAIQEAVAKRFGRL